MKKKLFELVLFIFIFIIFAFLGYTCPLKYLFGLSCPFCGITRAFISVIKLDFTAAFYYYALWPLILILIIGFILYEFKIIKLNKKTVYLFLTIFFISILIYYFYRLFNGSKIVYFKFSKSLIYKIITSLK